MWRSEISEVHITLRYKGYDDLHLLAPHTKSRGSRCVYLCVGACRLVGTRTCVCTRV